MPADSLVESDLWWHGPPWLGQPENSWPSSGIMALPQSLPELKAVTLTTIVEPVMPWSLWSRYSSFSTLTRVLSWIKRFINNARSSVQHRILQQTLTSDEISSTRIFIIHCAQKDSYSDIFTCVMKKRGLPKQHPFRGLNVCLNKNNLIVVSGRVRQRKSTAPKELIALSLKSPIAKLLITSSHQLHHHPGIAALMSILNHTYFIPGMRNFLKIISKRCAVCQRAYAKPLQQVMGLLPAVRTTPSPPFSSTGVDFAGPFTLRMGYTRKPVLIKTYACVFICLTTRAIHIELCSSLEADEFRAAFQRFCARRGCPTNVYSDNGTNFVGTFNEIQEIQQLLDSSKNAISSLYTHQPLHWHFIPPRTPHFGGIWEAGVKSMKVQLRKLISPHPLRFQELVTILTEVEAILILNSRPLSPLNSTELDNDLVLTPGHFLIGRPIKAPPTKPACTAKLSNLRRWSLVQRLQQDLWQAWSACYLQSIQARNKWKSKSVNIAVNDIVFVKDESLSTQRWPLGRVTMVYPGDDGHIRTVDLICNGKTYRRSIHRLIKIEMDKDTSQPPPEHVQDHKGP